MQYFTLIFHSFFFLDFFYIPSRCNSLETRTPSTLPVRSVVFTFGVASGGVGGTGMTSETVVVPLGPLVLVVVVVPI